MRSITTLHSPSQCLNYENCLCHCCCKLFFTIYTVELLHFSHFHHVSLVHWTKRSFPATGGSDLCSRGATHTLELRLPAEVGTISIIAIMLRYVFALLHNVLYLWRIAIASDSYRFRLFTGVIASVIYSSELAGQHYHFTLLLL